MSAKFAAQKHSEEDVVRRYVVLVRKEPQTDYWVDIPDIPGCASSGETAAEAVARFEEALCLHLKGMVEDGQPLPAPRGMEAVIAADIGNFAEIYTVEIIDPHLLLRLRFSKTVRPAA